MENNALYRELHELVGKPVKLIPSVFRHMYDGGKLRAEFLGEDDPEDDYRPEAWIWSTTQASTPGRENSPKEGYCSIASPSGQVVTIDEFIRLFPHETVGADHFTAYNGSLGVLVKIFDVGDLERIPIHWHPTPGFAQEHLGSPNGKNEAWIIIGIRNQGTAWIGWKEEISKEELINLINSKSIETIRSCMHEVSLKVGDVLSLPAGTVHAIGSGVCVLEPQEPTDFSIIADYGRFAATEEECHLGLGWDLALDSADLKATEATALYEKIAPVPGIAVDDGHGNVVERILSLKLEPYFWANRVTVASELSVPGDWGARCHCMVVLDGKGILAGSFEDVAIRKGESYFIPFGISYRIKCTSDDNLEAIRCYPPRVPRIGGVDQGEPEA